MSPHRLVPYQFAVRSWLTCLAVLGIAMGLAMVAGGPQRFGAAGFASARLVPGGVYSWGGLLAVAGAITLTGILGRWRRRIVMLGLLLEGAWFAFFAVALGSAAVADPHVAVTGPIVYGCVAALCAIGYDTGRWLRG